MTDKTPRPEGEADVKLVDELVRDAEAIAADNQRAEADNQRAEAEASIAANEPIEEYLLRTRARLKKGVKNMTMSEEDYDDGERCLWCSVDLQNAGTDTEYCSEECERGDVAHCARPLQNFLNAELGRETPGGWSKSIFDGTECGAWIEVHESTVSIGSIVEGGDVECYPEALSWPFTKDEFWGTVERINDAACVLYFLAIVAEANDGPED